MRAGIAFEKMNVKLQNQDMRLIFEKNLKFRTVFEIFYVPWSTPMANNNVFKFPLEFLCVLGIGYSDNAVLTSLIICKLTNLLVQWQ